MKKLLTILVMSLLMGTTVLAKEPFSIVETEMAVEKGQSIVLNYTNAENDILVNVENESGSTMWEFTFESNESGVINIDIPANNPLSRVYLTVINGDVEEIVQVDLLEPHEHQTVLYDFIRPSDTEPGRRSYFYCPGCDKYFEDRGGEVEITEPIDEWAYLAPVPKEEWDGPAPYIPCEDDKNVVDETKPNPSWEPEKVEEYYNKEEINIQNELEERVEVAESETDILVEEEKMPTTFALEPASEPVVEKVEPEPPTIWEKIKEFVINLFN